MTRIQSLFPGPYSNPRLGLASAGAARDLAGAGFGFKLLRFLLRQEPGSNALTSPASVAMLLHILHDAARGRTREELANLLEITGWSGEEIRDRIRVLMCVQHEPRNVELAIATALWFDRGMQYNNEFAATIARAFNAEIHTADFSSHALAPILNEWVRTATRQKISQIVSHVSPLLRVIALNVVYFKGLWEMLFDEEKTRERNFTLADGSHIRVPLMSKTETFEYQEGPDFQAVRLWYSGYRYAMDVVLPQATPQHFVTTRTYLAAGPRGECRVLFLSEVPRYRDDPVQQARQDAALAFIHLITNPYCVRLGACKRCKAFFVAKRNRRNNRYCSRRCAAATTAAKAMRRARASETSGKLDAIRAAIKSDKKTAERLLREKGITLTFLTRIVNAGRVKDIEDQVLALRSRVYVRGRPSK